MLQIVAVRADLKSDGAAPVVEPADVAAYRARALRRNHYSLVYPLGGALVSLIGHATLLHFTLSVSW